MVAEHLHAKSGWPSQSQKWFISKSLYIWAIHHKSTFLCKHSYRLVFDLVIAQSVDTSWENIVGIYMFASRPETLQEWISSINTLRKPLHGKLERWGAQCSYGKPVNVRMLHCLFHNFMHNYAVRKRSTCLLLHHITCVHFKVIIFGSSYILQVKTHVFSQFVLQYYSVRWRV